MTLPGNKVVNNIFLHFFAKLETCFFGYVTNIICYLAMLQTLHVFGYVENIV